MKRRLQPPKAAKTMHLWWADVSPQPPEEGHEERHHAVEHEVAYPANVQIDEANRRSDSRTPVCHQKKKVIRVSENFMEHPERSGIEPKRVQSSNSYSSSSSSPKAESSSSSSSPSAEASSSESKSSSSESSSSESSSSSSSSSKKKPSSSSSS